MRAASSTIYPRKVSGWSEAIKETHLATYSHKFSSSHLRILAIVKQALDQCLVGDADSDQQGLGILFMLQVDVMCSAQANRIIWGLEVVDAACDIEAHALVRVLIHESNELGNNVQLQQKIDSISLRVMSQEEWGNLQSQLNKVVGTFICLLAAVILQADLGRQVSIMAGKS